MALLWSTGIRQFVAQHGSYKRALQGGVMVIYSGTAPPSADYAAAAWTNQLALITLGSGGYTAEAQASASLTISGIAGSLDTLTVGAIEIMGTPVSFNTDLTTTAQDIVAQILRCLSNPEYEASSIGAVITVKSLMGTGVEQNGFILNCTSSGGLFEDCPQTFAGGISTVNGLTYDYAASGILTKTGVWSGIVANTGEASYWRIYGPLGNEWGSPAISTTALRVQGLCGTTTDDDYYMKSIDMVAYRTHIVESFNLEIPVS